MRLMCYQECYLENMFGIEVKIGLVFHPVICLLAVMCIITYNAVP